MSSLLEQIDSPADLQALPPELLPPLCEEIRERLIAVVSRTGGHLASNLGVVELTVALLRCFTPPADKIVWDVGHQTYAWKLLTGRRDRFDTLRRPDGLSGFTRREESPCDVFGAGHAGTALSAALGLAAARDRRGGGEHVLAVVGDAALANGISLEALNNVAAATSRLILVLNDNEMSIAGSVGSLSRLFGRLLASHHYNRWKSRLERAALRLRMSPLRHAYHRAEAAIKSLFVRNVIFEDLGLRYIGPIDGHDLAALTEALAIAKAYDRPIVLHVATEKGHGYAPAVREPQRWHGVGPFDAAGGEPPAARAGYSEAFGTALAALAANDERIVAITAAMRAGTGLDIFAERFPQRLHDVGICEAHAVVFAAGLAAAGMRPVVAVYSTFMQRAVDCVFHDVCLQRLPVVFCLDRAGVVGADGPTHHGIFDIPLLRSFPGLTIMQPRDEAMLARMLATALRHDGPGVIRYPRDPSPGVALPDEPEPLPIGTAEVILPAGGSAEAPVWIWALGDMVPTALEVAARLRAAAIETGVVDARFVKPLDRALLARQARTARLFVTLENGAVAGGFGSALRETLADVAPATPVRAFGWPDTIIGQGTAESLRRAHGLTAPDIAGAVAAACARPRTAATA